MDGFACRRDDIDKPLTVVETIAAGAVPKKRIGQGQCARIMTGAMVPEGADMVVMFEHTEERDGIVRAEPKSDNANIRAQAEEVKNSESQASWGVTVGAYFHFERRLGRSLSINRSISSLNSCISSS